MSAEVAPGQHLEIEIDRMAHGGEGIGTVDGRVVFVAGAFPGDRVRARLGQVKKSFAKAEVSEVLRASELRGGQRCPAAAAGAGCCDFAEAKPEAELELKAAILRDQLQRVGRFEELPEIHATDLEPLSHWRTRVRLGVDEQGRAGLRKRSSNEVLTEVSCTQPVEGLLDDLVGESVGLRFRPGAEVVACLDSFGERSVVEVRRAPRGRRSETISRVVEGDGTVRQRIGETTFSFPATGFWQAHRGAPEAYSALIEDWTKELAPQGELVAWDLYGGVGAFVPALLSALGPQARVHSVESFAAAATCGERALADYGDRVVFHTGTVAGALGQLPSPDLVLLDPPRVGAGCDVVAAIAGTGVASVIHIGCDPATFARDAQAWRESGYHLERVHMINAFPGTHHFETFGLFRKQA